MILLLLIALFCLACGSYLALILPLGKTKHSLPASSFTPGTRICTMAGSKGTVVCVQSNRLSIFFDDGSRGILLPEQIEKII